MSWQATAWAVKRLTGSSARKLLLLTLANYANDVGYCWPSQKTLSDDTEQSPDTVQRQLKRLAADGHIFIEKRKRASGRWPALAYRLNMAAPTVTMPQSAARSEPVTQCDAGDLIRAQCGTAMPQPARPPCRTAMRHEPSREHLKNETLLPSSSLSMPPREAKLSADEKKRERPEVVHACIAKRLGRGDVASGWLIFGTLSDSSREFLTSCERNGSLTEAIIDQHRAHVHAEMRRASSGVGP